MWIIRFYLFIVKSYHSRKFRILKKYQCNKSEADKNNQKLIETNLPGRRQKKEK